MDLVTACKNNKTRIALSLLDQDVDVNILNDNDRSALYYACIYNNVELVLRLIEKGANIKDLVILATFTLNCEESAMILFEKGANFNSAISHAIKANGMIEEALNMIRIGASSIKGENGKRLFVLACKVYKPQIAIALFEVGVPLTIEASYATILLSQICDEDNIRALLKFVDAGFNNRLRPEIVEKLLRRRKTSTIVILIKNWNINVEIYTSLDDYCSEGINFWRRAIFQSLEMMMLDLFVSDIEELFLYQEIFGYL